MYSFRASGKWSSKRFNVGRSIADLVSVGMGPGSGIYKFSKALVDTIRRCHLTLRWLGPSTAHLVITCNNILHKNALCSLEVMANDHHLANGWLQDGETNPGQPMEEEKMAVSSIADINAKFHYDDKVAGGNGDGALVSCGQHGTYNELSYIYTTYLKPLVVKGTITEAAALNAIDQACSLPSPRQRDAFYKKVEESLGRKVFS